MRDIFWLIIFMCSSRVKLGNNPDNQPDKYLPTSYWSWEELVPATPSCPGMTVWRGETGEEGWENVWGFVQWSGSSPVTAPRHSRSSGCPPWWGDTPAPAPRRSYTRLCRSGESKVEDWRSPSSRLELRRGQVSWGECRSRRRERRWRGLRNQPGSLLQLRPETYF